uniref:MICOS complex subunit n=1 Tax=Clastoptera arizonana TaxID=38151 RepID=A0A1B6CFL1_9HEMI
MRGIITSKVLKKILLPTSYGALAAAAISQGENNETKKINKPLIRPHDLPIYPYEQTKKTVKSKETEADSIILSTVRQIRVGIWGVLNQANELTDKTNHVIETGTAHTLTTISFLREDDNLIQRYCAIGAGGLLGLIISIRRGLFKRILYTTTGAVGVAAVLYPKEAREYSSGGLKEAKKYAIVGYHFLNGVLRDYTGMQLPQLPEPLSMSSNSAEKDMSREGMLPPSHIHPPSIPSPPIDAPSNKSGK